MAEDPAAYIAALTSELRACKALGRRSRVAAIEAELTRIGAAGKAPARRAQRRAAEPAPRATER